MTDKEKQIAKEELIENLKKDFYEKMNESFKLFKLYDDAVKTIKAIENYRKERGL